MNWKMKFIIFEDKNFWKLFLNLSLSHVNCCDMIIHEEKIGLYNKTSNISPAGQFQVNRKLK